MNYRGYEIAKHPVDGYIIRKDGRAECSQPSVDFARKWIDRAMREADTKKGPSPKGGPAGRTGEV